MKKRSKHGWEFDLFFIILIIVGMIALRGFAMPWAFNMKDDYFWVWLAVLFIAFIYMAIYLIKHTIQFIKKVTR